MLECPQTQLTKFYSNEDDKSRSCSDYDQKDFETFCKLVNRFEEENYRNYS